MLSSDVAVVAEEVRSVLRGLAVILKLCCGTMGLGDGFLLMSG